MTNHWMVLDLAWAARNQYPVWIPAGLQERIDKIVRPRWRTHTFDLEVELVYGGGTPAKVRRLHQAAEQLRRIYVSVQRGGRAIE